MQVKFNFIANSLLLCLIVVQDVVDSDRSPEKELRKQLHRQQKAQRKIMKKLTRAGLLPDAQGSFIPDQSFPQTEGCQAGTFCVRVRDCPFVSDQNAGQPCVLGQNVRGVCCAAGSNTGFNEEPQRPPRRPLNPVQKFSEATGIPIITPQAIRQAVQSATQWMQGLKNREQNIQSNQLFATSFSEEGQHQNFLGNNQRSNQLGQIAEFFIRMVRNLMTNFNLTPQQSEQAFKAVSFVNSVTGNCPRPVQCPRGSENFKYRTADGRCNNKNNPDWGMAFSPFNRLLPPMYGDGFDSPRVIGSNGQLLPSARIVSATVGPDNVNAMSDKLTFLTMQWGQFIDHDITGAATTRSQDGKSIKCCDPAMEQNPELRHPACFVIEIPRNDPFFGKVGRTCLSFVRSSPAPRVGCAFGQREQLNQLSSYIDGGMVYGKSVEDHRRLRSFKDGKLKASIVDGTDFLPQKAEGCSIPRPKRQTQGCFFSGDGRVNVQANLVVMHALFLRHHNRIAGQLQQINPHWNDEILFQETRRIVIAQIQMITYNEFLPVVLGGKTMQDFNLKIQPNGQYSNSYDGNINAGIVSAFATAAYRMHTLIPRSLDFVSDQGKVGHIDLSETFNNPSVLYERGAFTHLLNGMSTESSSEYDSFFTNQISQHMFRPFGANSGIDLIAVNIQRGRDHGLPPFNAFRSKCGLRPLKTWEDMSTVMRAGAVQALRSVYSSPEDIDLFVGGVAEMPESGSNSLVGPTFACIIGEQFWKIKDGDRFWFENSNQGSSFSPEQLTEIKKTTLAQIVCHAGQDITKIQPHAFLKENEWNVKTDCQALEGPDLRFWQNT